MHALWETSTAGLGLGWDFTDALFINGEGDDRYELKGNGLGLSTGRDACVPRAAARTMVSGITG